MLCLFIMGGSNMVYILNTNHNMLHKPTCGRVQLMDKNNMQYCDEIPKWCIPCSHCKPHLDNCTDGDDL